MNASQFHADKFAVVLHASNNGAGNSFITGPLTLPSGVTLVIDTGVTMYATRDVMAYMPGLPYKNGTLAAGLPTAPTVAQPSVGKYCANVATPSNVANASSSSNMSSGSSSNCAALISGEYLVNSAVMGGGNIDSRGASEIVSTDALYPLMRADLTCTNTYYSYNLGQQATNGTPCDDGGTTVDLTSDARHMSWWDLAWLGNMVENGETGVGSQSVFKMMVFSYVKNLTVAGVTMNNSANYHLVPQGVDGLTVWGAKIQTPSLSATANPAGNGNPNYLGMLPTITTAKNTDGIDPASMSKPGLNKLMIGSGKNNYSTAGSVTFDGYMKNTVIAYNYLSEGDDNVSPKGSNNPLTSFTSFKDSNNNPIYGTFDGVSTAATGYGIDGDRNKATDRKYGFVIAHNHIYYGHGVSIGSETNSNVRNMHVYDNSFDGGETALRIKSDWARGGQVNNIDYHDICIRNAGTAILDTPYYSTKALPSAGAANGGASGSVAPLYPNFTAITMTDIKIMGSTALTLQGFQANNGYTWADGTTNPQFPLGLTLNNVLADSPNTIATTSSDANIVANNTNLPIFQSTANRVNITGTTTNAVPSTYTVDCSNAFVDFPGIGTSSPSGQTWPGQTAAAAQ